VSDTVENRFNIESVNWNEVLKIINESYLGKLKDEFEECNETLYKMLSLTRVSDLILIEPLCSEKSVDEIERPNNYFGALSARLTLELQSLLIDKFDVPKPCALRIFLRNLPHPAPLNNANFTGRGRKCCDEKGELCFLLDG
jgi:hypothetical protein